MRPSPHLTRSQADLLAAGHAFFADFVPPPGSVRTPEVLRAALREWLSAPDRLGQAGADAWLAAVDAPSTKSRRIVAPVEGPPAPLRSSRAGRALTRPAAAPRTNVDIQLLVKQQEAEQAARRDAWMGAKVRARWHAEMDANSRRVAREYKAQLERARSNRRKRAAWRAP